jgi:spermidine/putrescine transport system permease protein
MYTDTAICIGLLYSFLPFMVLPLYASLEKLDFRYVEAGFDLYATRRKVLTRIIIPLSKPGIVAGCLLVFIPAIGAYVTPLLLGGGKKLMIGNLIALQFGSSRNWPFGCAAALILMAIVLAALMIYARSGARKSAGVHG